MRGRSVGWVLVLVTGAVAAACGSAVGVPQNLVAPVISTPTPLALESPTPGGAPARTPRPTKGASSGGAFYKPPGWDGHSDVDCPDFDTHAHAQSFFVGTGGSRSNDPYRLDSNHDGVACESLP